jgi:hypothetical protein
MSRATRTIWLAAAGAGTAALATSAALALGQSSDIAQRPEPAPPVKSVPRDVADQLSAFRRAQAPSDKMPGDPVADLEKTGTRQAGENPVLARRLAVGSRGQAYAWPMADGVCYASPGPAGCVPTKLLEQRGATIATSSSSTSPTVQVFGLAADGVKSVDLDLETGQTVTARVQDGAFYIELAADPLQARWTLADGTIMTQAPLVGG